MVRRNFIRKITAAGVGGAAALQVGHASARNTVVFTVKGFTCVTCAVGLETMLRAEKGVVHAEASYAKARVVIDYDPAVVTAGALQGFIAGMGFTAENGKHGNA